MTPAFEGDQNRLAPDAASSPPTPANASSDRDWVRAGFEGRPWTEMLESREALLTRLGIWWAKNQGTLPLSVDVISDQIVIIDGLVLMVDRYGDILDIYDVAKPSLRPVAAP